MKTALRLYTVVMLCATAAALPGAAQVPNRPATLATAINDQPEAPVWTWDALPATVARQLDATVGFGPSWVGFFSGETILVYPLYSEDTPDALVWLDLRDIDGWPVDWTGGIDASVEWNELTRLFIKGDEYVIYDMQTDRIIERSTFQAIPETWGGHIGAAVRWDADLILLFNGREYVEYNFVENTITPPVMLDWEGWPAHWEGIDAAMNTGFSLVYFFSQGEYLPFVLGLPEGQAGFLSDYPKPLAQP